MISNEQAKHLIYLTAVKEMTLERARAHPNVDAYNKEYAQAVIDWFEYLIDLVKD